MLKHAQGTASPAFAFRHDLPPEIEPIVWQAMAKKRKMRFRRVDDLRALARGSKILTSETGVISRAAAENRLNIFGKRSLSFGGNFALAIGMIYATSVKQTNPTTQMQTDVNGQPVQPINPATG